MTQHGIEHLFTDTVRDTMGSGVYGDWRSIQNADAVPLAFGFPYPESLPNGELVSAAESLLAAEPDRALQYGGGDRAAGLRDVIVDRARDRGIDCSTDAIHLTNGATRAIDTVCRVFLEPGDEVVVEAPTFMGALGIFRNHGATVTGVDVDEEGLDVDALAEDLAARAERGAPGPKLVYTIPDFQNPTGVTMATDRRELLLDLAETHDFVVLEDDPYGRLRYDGVDRPPLKALDSADRTVRINTFSKTIAPGVRTGWIVADERTAAQFDRIDAGGEPSFTRGLIDTYCADGRLDRAVSRLCEGYEERRDRMLASLDAYMPPDVGWSEPSGGFFVWIEFPDGTDTEAMLPEAIDAGVTYLPGSFFYAGDDGDRFARLSFSHAAPAAIEDGIEALARTVSDGVPSTDGRLGRGR
ncbi:MAG: PLP-dependent aminotransferase family protein [Halorubrum sp.]|uniref:aminotransferase-like domain-containing protein n=1 Tax=Halorubrum sp. TaxID=1879286 RepID=UPI0039704E84